MLSHPFKRSLTYLALLGPLLWAGGSASSAPSRQPAAPLAAMVDASALMALPQGSWLLQQKNSLRLIDANGQQQATLALRSKQLDLRATTDGALAMVLDADHGRPQAIRVDTRSGQLQALPALPDPAFGIEAMCLYRDAQQALHLFLIGKDGQAEQWLLRDSGYLLLRRLALPPGSEHCRVDDASHTLFVSEPGFGVWAYNADGEDVPQRQPVLLRQPYGPLPAGPAALAPLPGGLAVLSEDGQTLHLQQHQRQQWRALPAHRLPQAVDAETLALAPHPSRLQLLLRGKNGWQLHQQGWRKAAAGATPLPVLQPRHQTEPVARLGDAADDPAIWVHPGDASQSRVLGTNKKQGLLAYDLQGRQQQLLEVGRINNVDLRQRVMLDGQQHDLALATRRDDNTLLLFGIDSSGRISQLASIPTGLDEVYGVCLYQPPQGGLEAFVNDKDGRYLHFRITLAGGVFGAQRLRQLQLASQPEGCVVDDRNGRLFIGEEKRGIWVTSADAAHATPLQLVMPVGRQLVADVEGLALYHGAARSYLLVSSQGNNSYLVLEASPPYRYRGAFRVGINAGAGIDGTSETDGLDVSSADFGGPYRHGMLVVQDGYKRMPDGPQNFKYIAWQDIATALALD
jgi:3-phytase